MVFGLGGMFETSWLRRSDGENRGGEEEGVGEGFM